MCCWYKLLLAIDDDDGDKLAPVVVGILMELVVVVVVEVNVGVEGGKNNWDFVSRISLFELAWPTMKALLSAVDDADDDDDKSED